MRDAIILVGGLGTRLQKIVSQVPKPLAPINGTPFLDLLLQHFYASGQVRRIILAIGHKAHLIRAYYEKTSFPLLFSEETSPLGTAGALKQALPLAATEDVWVLNGDSFFDVPFEKMRLAHQQNNADLTIACKEMEDVSRYGSVAFGFDQRISNFQEKEAACGKGWINGGIYLMKRTLLESFSAFSLEKEVFPALLNKRVFAYPFPGKFIDIGTEESYHQAQEVFR